ncbi:30S ribosomal protein S2 [Candidatus Hepatincola sp. Av]
MVSFTIKQLLENGVHYGHHTRRWNPKMAPYIYGTYNNIHIINLQKTAPMLHKALQQIKKVAATDGRILFVGTKSQASEIIKESAERCGQYYVNHRWLGGMLTNWKTISNSITKLDELDKKIAEDLSGLTKKEKLELTRQRDKLQLVLGGIREMAGLPDIIFVLDSSKEFIAIDEARKLKIPLVAIVDTNSNPELVDYPIPGNDDAIKSIKTYCELFSQAVLEGLQEAVANKVPDLGASEDVDTINTTDSSVAEENVLEPSTETVKKSTPKKEATNKDKAKKTPVVEIVNNETSNEEKILTKETTASAKASSKTAVTKETKKEKTAVKKEA